MMASHTKPKLDLIRPSVARDSRVQRAAERIEQGHRRLVVELSAERHQALKAHAATLGMTMRQYVEHLLERAGCFEDK